MNKYLILGSNSFSGQDFIRLLLEKNENVLGISRSPQKNIDFLSYPKNHKNFIFEQCNIRNTEKLTSIYNIYKPDYIVNFAAQTEVSPSWKFPLDWYETNVIALLRFIQTIYNHSHKIKKFLQISTPEVYGSAYVINGGFHFDPSTPYAASKASADLILNVYQKSNNFPVVYVRSSNVYGPYQSLYKIIPKTIATIILNKKLKLHGKGKSQRCFIHINDVSRAEYIVLHKGIIGNIYHISNDVILSIKDLVYQICLLMNVISQDYIIETNDDRCGKDQLYQLGNEAIKQLGWLPKIELQQGIQTVIDWINKLSINILEKNLIYQHIHE